jgi:hypothetical protein
VRGQAPPQNTCVSRIPFTRWREATCWFLCQAVLSTMCVCNSLSLLPRSWPPCLPPLPTTALHMRCGLCTRPEWGPSSVVVYE